MKLPTSPRSTNISSCLGNISHPPWPMTEAISDALSLNSPALIHSVIKKNMCAPPDLLRQTTQGIFNFLSCLSKAIWSNGYMSMSKAPNLHWLSSLIGIDPTPRTPDKWPLTSSSVSGDLFIYEFADCLPALRSADILVCPWASLKPSKADINFFTLSILTFLLKRIRAEYP